MKNQRDPRRGQALILVTFALIAMCGLLGLAVDLGWGYFVKKSAQVSADGGALAAAQYTLNHVGQTQPFTVKMGYSGTNTCPDALDLGLSTGCQYAQQAGFAGTIAMTSGTTFPPATVPNLSAGFYWVTARAVETIPQLFSAVLGNPTGISSARASAAVVTEYINGGLHTLNRQYDNITVSGLPQGADIGGSGQIIVSSGLFMSSASANAGSGPSVTGPVTIVSPGNAAGLGASPITDIGDSAVFLDPYRGINAGQPELPSKTGDAGAPGSLGALPTYGVLNGTIASGNVYLLAGLQVQQAIGSPFPSGNYVPIYCNPLPCGSGTVVLDTVDQLTLGQSATFSDTVPTCYPTTSSTFGCFFFYGGLRVSGGTMTMGAGEFVMVGGGSAGKDFTVASNAYIDSLVSCPNPTNCTTAGVMFIMTGSSSPFICSGSSCTGNANGDLYPNLGQQLVSSNPLLVQAAQAGMLNFGTTSILSGADGASAAVTGLVAKNLPLNLPASNAFSLVNTLGPFDGVVFWQDQANSTIEYTQYGNVNTSCAGGIDNPCTKTLPVVGSEGLTLQALPNTGIEGVVYQPRGAFLQTQGGTIQGPIQIITGAISMQGGGKISLTPPPTSAKRRVVALVE
jgi:hypothetical protein